MKRMLINATQEEELRMAMVDGQRLYDLNIELPSGERKKANIYKGKITRIEPSLEAAFVNYGADRHGFLPLKEISSEYFVKNVDSGKPNIREVLKEGQDIVVQIDKEERGNKGAALTTFVSLAGRFIVLKPNKARSGGVSRRIVGEDRDVARQAMRDVDIPNSMSVIVRTAGIDRTPEELGWDLENLLAVWEAIKKVVVDRPSPFLIYRESNAVVRALRDYLTSDIGEILIDDDAAYDEARQFVEQVMPHNLRKLKHYTDPVPLFTRYQIETQIESAFAHAVSLPSGGSLVVDHTEALVSIDINSARATKGGDIEATALNTNLEAADEIGRQLRLRDLGGLIVIDFIDMGPQKNQRDVENRLREAVRQDRARVQIGKISRFGLLEMSRQRLRPSLGESSYLTCPRCSGIGTIRSVESLALAILRIIGEEARKERTAKVIAQLPVEVATYLLNEKRDWVQNLESRHDTQVILVANSALETPHYRIRRVRDDQVELPENAGSSYALAEVDEEPGVPESLQDAKPAEVPAVTTIVPATPAPVREQPEEEKAPGLLARMFGLFSRPTESKPKSKKHKTVKKPHKTREARRGQRGKRADGSKDAGKRTERAKSGSKKRARNSEHADTRNAQNGHSDARSDKPVKAQSDDSRDEPRKGKRRRSRGGRRRRKNGDSTDARTTNNVPKQDAREESGNDSKAPSGKDQQPSQAAAGNGGGQRKERSRKRTTREPAAAPTDSPSEERASPKEAAALSAGAATRQGEDKDTASTQPARPKRPEAKTQAPAPEPASVQLPDPAGKGGPDTSDAGTPESAKSGAGHTKQSNLGDIEHEETQPNLPTLQEAKADKPAGDTAARAAKPAARSDAVDEAKPVEDTKRPELGSNGDKLQDRLLPWEPTAQSTDDKPVKDEGSAQH